MNSVKKHICHVKNREFALIYLHQGRAKIFPPFREGFIFAKFCKSRTLAKISEFTVLFSVQTSRIHTIVRNKLSPDM